MLGEIFLDYLSSIVISPVWDVTRLLNIPNVVQLSSGAFFNHPGCVSATHSMLLSGAESMCVPVRR